MTNYISIAASLLLMPGLASFLEKSPPRLSTFRHTERCAMRRHARSLDGPRRADIRERKRPRRSFLFRAAAMSAIISRAGFSRARRWAAESGQHRLSLTASPLISRTPCPRRNAGYMRATASAAHCCSGRARHESKKRRFFAESGVTLATQHAMDTRAQLAHDYIGAISASNDCRYIGAGILPSRSISHATAISNRRQIKKISRHDMSAARGCRHQMQLREITRLAISICACRRFRPAALMCWPAMMDIHTKGRWCSDGQREVGRSFRQFLLRVMRAIAFMSRR